VSQIKPLRGTFGRAQRSELTTKVNTPGPDAYQRIEIRSKKNSNAELCTFGMKTTKFFQANKNPAPNAYSP
jgi:hypothetical protein